MIWGFVGGRDYDAHGLTALLVSVPPTDIIAVGSGIGSEKFVREQGPELGLNVEVAPLRADLFDFPRPGAIKVGTPPVTPTRLHMLARSDQAMLWGAARHAENVGGKAKGALEAQVTDVVVASMGGKLVLMGGARAKIAADIVKRCTGTTTYNNERERVEFTPLWEVVTL